MSLNYMRLWIDDYSKDTTSLSVAEHGAYLLLLLDYYKSGPLPADEQALFRICRALTEDEQRAVSSVAERFFKPNGDGRLHNKRADKELEIAGEAIAAMRAGGAKGAKARGKKRRNRVTDKVGQGVPQSVPQGVGMDLPTPASKPLSLQSSKPLSLEAAEPPTLQPKAAAERRSAEREAARSDNGKGSKTGLVEAAYSQAYRQRYSIEPVVNAKVRAVLSRFVDRLGKEEAPQVAAFYLMHNRRVYVEAGHPVDLLLRDAENLRREWATGKPGTETEARQRDRTAATAAAFAQEYAKASERERVADASE